MQESFVMAMPGNPLAAILNILLLGVPLLLKMQGANSYNHSTKRVKLAKELRLNPKRSNIVLGEVKDGIFSPYKDNRYGSGMISPLVASNAVAVFDEGKAKITDSELIDIIELGCK